MSGGSGSVSPFRRRRPLFGLLGFPIYVPASAWLGIALIAYLNAPAFAKYGGAISTMAFAFGLYMSVIVHELAHALVARATGHHVFGIELGILGGATMYDSSMRANPKYELRVALAGPVSSIMLGFAITGMVRGREAGVVVAVAAWLGIMNIVLGVLNLLPAAPLDGGHVCEALVWRLTGSRRLGMRVTAVLGYLLATLLLSNGLDSASTATGQWSMFLAFVFALNAGAMWNGSRSARGT